MFSCMRTNRAAWNLYRVRVWAGLLLLLGLSWAVSCAPFRAATGNGRSPAPPVSAPELSTWFAGGF